MPKLNKKIAIALSAAAIVAIGGGTAFAYWTTSGSGTGTASTTAGTADLTVTQTAAPTNLAPGVPAGAIAGTVKNNAVNNAKVDSVTVSIASVSGGVGTCSASDYDLSNPIMTVGTDLIPNQTVSFSGASLGFHNDPSANQDGCKGATVHLLYTVNSA
jgi:hypothetical protein